MKSETVHTFSLPTVDRQSTSVLRGRSGEPFDPAVARPALLHELFEAHADAHPLQTAVENGDKRLSYRELEAQANQLAHQLRRLGIGRGACVALQLERTTELYVAMFAVLKTGAAYVPLDPDCPAERVRFVLNDCGAKILLTNPFLSEQRRAIARCPVTRLTGTATPDDVAYIIYTSGSTGRPKGVQVEHRSVCNFIRAERRVFPLRPTDRVYQGLSLAFDASVEEMWLAFNAGATLVAATREMMQSGPDLARHLRAARVTVVSTVPTLWSMLDEDIPTLRLLIFGGEACPQDLVRRWWKPNRRILNTYGPTEATVTATWSELQPDKPVTIGRPLPNYRVYVLDEELQMATEGELHIGGIGLARGYVNRPELTREKFIANPYANGDHAPLVYKTGDRVRWTQDGELEFLGRLDSQVKLRGYRIELGEIESALIDFPGVTAAAVTLRDDTQQLVGYIVSSRPLDPAGIRAKLRERLPAYMVPPILETIPALPMLPSGKVDRKSLPRPRTRVAAGGGQARTPAEKKILAVWGELFAPLPVSVRDDFFLDLSGHSLLAARLVSVLRRDPDFRGISVLDVYRNPTVEKLAARNFKKSGRASRPCHTPSRLAHFGCGALQAVALYFVFGVRAIEWITPYLVFFILLERGLPTLAAAGWAVASLVAVFPLLAFLAIAVKWLVLGRIRAGLHPVWGWYYFRWWFVQTMIASVPVNYLAGTPLLPVFYRLLGAQIGKNVYLGTENLAAFDLTSIGDGASVDDEASLFGQTIEGSELIIGPVTVGCRCFVGTRSVLRENTVLEDGARLEDLSLLPSGMRIPAGETWAGSPAQRVAIPGPAIPPRPAHSPWVTMLYAALVFVIPVLLLVAFVPGVAILTRLDLLAHPFRYLAATPLVGATFVLLVAAEVTVLKWLLVGRVRVGSYPVHGSFFVRHWVVERLFGMSLDVIAPLHATLWLIPWYRALGAKLGRLVELSTATSMVPDLLEIKDGGTVADESSLGAGRVEGGWLTLGRTCVGRRAFIGNSAVVPAGVELGDGSLVGVLSMTPAPNEAAKPGTAWLGSPPVRLPHREPSAGFIEQRTYCPQRWLIGTRATVEVLRITLPPSGFVLVTATVVTAMVALLHRVGFASLGLLPVVYGGCCLAVILAVALVKWMVMGRYRPFVRPLWSTFVWRLEFVNALYEFLATPLALGALQGTPFLPWYFRLLGARIGRGVYAHTTGLLEWDIVEIGDRVALNDDCVLQTHLFEDRMLKASRLRVGADCAIGAGSVVLYDSVMEDGARLDAVSLLMKGEVLPAGTTWAGSPTRRSPGHE